MPCYDALYSFYSENDNDGQVSLFTLRAMRMMRLVRLRLRTSELVEALDITSRAVVSRGASWAAARPENVTQLFYFAIWMDIWQI